MKENVISKQIVASLQTLPLVLLFNGMLLYLYIVYKSGHYTDRLATGAYFAILCVLSLICGAYACQKEKRFFQWNLADTLFVLYWGYIFLSYLVVSFREPVSTKKLLYAPFLVIMPYFSARCLFHGEIKRFFCLTLIVFSTALLIVAYAELVFNQDLVNARTRFSMFFFEGSSKPENPVLFGVTFAILNMICVCRLMQHNKMSVLLCLIVTASTYLIVRSGSRGVIVSYHAALFLYLFLISRRKLLLKMTTFSISVAMFLVFVFLSPPALKNFYGLSISSQSLSSEESSYHMRLELYKETSVAVDSLLFGKSIGASAGGSGYAHNIVLEQISEFGLVGTGLFLCFMFVCLKRWYLCWRNSREEPFYAELQILFFLFFIVEAMFSGQITQQTQLFVCMGFLSMSQDKVLS